MVDHRCSFLANLVQATKPHAERDLPKGGSRWLPATSSACFGEAVKSGEGHRGSLLFSLQKAGCHAPATTLPTSPTAFLMVIRASAVSYLMHYPGFPAPPAEASSNSAALLLGAARISCLMLQPVVGCGCVLTPLSSGLR